MDNVSANTSVMDDVAAVIGSATADGALLLIVFTNTVFNLFVIAAIFQDNSELVRSIRVILINILVACVIGGLASVMYHISSPVLRIQDSDSVLGPPLCHAIVFLNHSGSIGRVLFAAYYGVTVFIVVHFWNKPVLAPRNTKYFILASAFVWLPSVLVGFATFFDETVSGFCTNSRSSIIRDTLNTSSQFTLPVTIPYFVVSAIPIIVTPSILIEISCYIKCKTIGEHRDTKKALVKFGLFLMIIQGVNVFAQIVVPLVVIGIGSQNYISLAFIIGYTLTDLSRIPTTLLIIIFFKPVRVKVKRWLCCCYHRHKAAKMNRSRIATV